VARLRRPTAAGAFYPSDPAALESVLDDLLQSTRTERAARAPRGLIVPHAGYRFSGPIAASAYALLVDGKRAIDRVVLLGPAHFVNLDGAAVPEATGWHTPLGVVSIDHNLVRRAQSLGAAVDDKSHAPEHALEVQMPFLQFVLGNEVPMLPVAVGVAEPARVADLLDGLVEPGVLLVVSTDLSHYEDDETAKRLDRRTAEAITARASDAVGLRDACGFFAVRGLVEWSRRGGLPIRLLDLRTSADTAGDRSRVVGYGAFALA